MGSVAHTIKVFGQRRVTPRTFGKGISKELADEALAQLSDDDETSAAEQLIRRKLRTTTDVQDRGARDKLCRRLVSMLARKGYQPGLAFSIVNRELDALNQSS